MRIGMVCYPTHGGSGVVASELALALAHRGHQVHIISYAVPFRLREFHPNVSLHEVDIAVYPLFKYPPYELGLSNKIVEVAQEHGLDIIHAHYAVPHATSAYLAKHILNSPKLKIITTLHGTDITLVGADKSFFSVIKFSIEQSDGVTAVSNYLQKRTMSEFGVNRDIRVIHNFIDSEKYRQPKECPCKREVYAKADEKILMHASNFRPVKRVSDVVRIFARVRQEMPCKLLLVGEGPERLFAQQLVKELNLQADVRFLGQIDQIESILMCADVFLLPSEQESFGLAALEALACGVPVVGATTGGLPEVVRHGETGYLYPVGEIRDMALAALDILGDDQRYQRFSETARKQATKNFDIKVILPQWEAYYQEVLGK
jgi:N-acetyl-alpha-D-glucosaminyl L-malate synthase BshA